LTTKVRLNGEDRRAQIIETALSVFSEKGFSGSRIKEIAELAGISETLIFQHFASKEELYRVTLQTLFSHHPVLPEVEAAIQTKNDRHVFSSIAAHLINHGQQDPRIIRLALFAALEKLQFKEITHNGAETSLTLTDLLASYIQQRIDDGVFRKINATIAARLIIETVYMYAFDQHAAISGPVLPNPGDEVIETLTTLFLNGLKS